MEILARYALSSCISIQPLASLRALCIEVRANPCGVEAVIRYINHTVNDDNRDSSILSFLQYSVPTSLSNWSQNDVVYILLDEVTDGCDLILLLLLCVIEDELVAICLGECLLHRLGVSCTPVRLSTYL